MITIISFSGPSGSGKTVLAKELLRLYPDYTTWWRQITTRKRRGPDDEYVFVNDAQYRAMEPLLICKTNFNGMLYGTIPEVGAEGKAMLTVVDANGVENLIRDVAEHNAALDRGEAGKLGSEPAKLVKVLMSYTVTEEAMAERGGRPGRTAEFVGEEYQKLLRLEDRMLNPATEGDLDLRGFSYAGGGSGPKFDVRIDTSNGNWPLAMPFFDQHVWPAISEPAEPSLADRRHALSLLLARAQASVQDMGPAGVGALAVFLEEFLIDPAPAAGEIDAVDDALTGPGEDWDATESVGASLLAAVAEASAGKDWEAPEPMTASLLEAMEGQEGAPAGRPPAEVEVEGERDEVYERLMEEAAKGTLTNSSEEPERLPEAAPGAAPPTGEEAGRQAAQDLIDARAAGAAAPAAKGTTSKAKYRTLLDLTASVDIETWIVETARLGLSWAKDMSTFREMFSLYTSTNKCVLDGEVHYGVQVSQDGKGGRVLGFSVRCGTEVFNVEYSERIKRIIRHGIG